MARHDDLGAADQPTNDHEEACDDNGDDGAGFEFAAAWREAAQLAPADDLFAHGRILPAYPVFQRRNDPLTAAPDTYCAWAPRSAPGSPARDRANFPKSASTGSSEARRFWRLRDLVGGRSHSEQKQQQSKKSKGTTTEMGMATAHRLFYGADRKQHASYLPYRTGIVGFFATAHARTTRAS